MVQEDIIYQIYLFSYSLALVSLNLRIYHVAQTKMTMFLLCRELRFFEMSLKAAKIGTQKGANQ